MANLDQHRKSREFKRRFLAEETDLGSWDELDIKFKELKERPLDTPEQCEAWLLDLSELQSAISEEFSARYIAMTCHTEDPALEQSYLHYVENILPRTEAEYFDLNKKYLDAPGKPHMPQERYFVLNRAKENDVAIFREENIPLHTEDEKLSQQYQKIFGEMTVEFDGREQTLAQMARYQEETDRDVRRQAWVASAGRQLSGRMAIETIFDQMIKLRDRMAKNAGFDSYIDYQFRRLGRFDYGPEECRAFHDAIETGVVPLRRTLREARRRQLGLEKLAPWDLEVDPLGRPPLRPFNDAAELINGTDRIFNAVAPVFSQDFHVLRDRGLLDLESRKGKAPGGYQSTLDEARLPFIFMNAAGRNTDVFTLLHEGGHAFHALASREESLYPYRQPPIEFCEVASMGMEMMAAEKLEAFYDGESAKRARQKHLEDVIIILPWIARVDAFQHWIYTHPGHSRAEREDEWLRLDERFGDDLKWPELPEWRGCSWIRQLHFFCVPLYYIEYGIAQLGALQLWRRYLQNRDEAIEGYRSGLRLGNARPLPELFGAAGLRFSFDRETIQPLMEEVEKHIAA